jgi:hypothetical protein
MNLLNTKIQTIEGVSERNFFFRPTNEQTDTALIEIRQLDELKNRLVLINETAISIKIII